MDLNKWWICPEALVGPRPRAAASRTTGAPVRAGPLASRPLAGTPRFRVLCDPMDLNKWWICPKALVGPRPGAVASRTTRAPVRAGPLASRPLAGTRRFRVSRDSMDLNKWWICPGGTDQNVGVIDTTDAQRSSRSGWRAPTTRGPPRTGARRTPGLWICGKPFRFPTSSTGRHRRPASRLESRQRDICRGQPGHRVADRRRRRARRRPADR